MLQSFYNYIAKELIADYFKKNPPQKGSRYFMVVENETHRKCLLESLSKLCAPISISGIYQGINSLVEEDEYQTYVLPLPGNNPSIIIGYDRTSTEDYLTTLRNSVGLEGGKYENYAVIYILSDSVLSSIITACQDLQSIGGPLHSSYIIHDIMLKADTKITKKFELEYLNKYLEKIRNYIADGTCNLFDFNHALSIIDEGTLAGHFDELEFFSDTAIYDPAFTPQMQELRNRIDQNGDYFKKVRDIMNLDDEKDKITLLEKFLDEKLTKKILSSGDDWKSIDLQKFIDSKNRKDTTANLELLSIKLQSEGLLTSLVSYTKGNVKKKTSSYILVCDTTDETSQKVTIAFNKEIPKIQNDCCCTRGNELIIDVSDTLCKPKVGLNDNRHDFYLLRIPCAKSFFKDIENCFSISAKGEIVVTVPDDRKVLTFGDGTDVATIPLDGRVVWNDNLKLDVPVSVDSDIEQIDFSVDFKGQEVRFKLKLNVAESVPPARPGSINNGTYEDGVVMVDDTPWPIYNFWKKYLEWEKMFIEEECHFIYHSANSITEEYEANPQPLILSHTVGGALSDIYAYFREKRTVPSLWHMDDELRFLYIRYWKSIIDTINNIPSTRCLTKEEHCLTQLGVVLDGEKTYLSPFHPLLVAYALEYDAQYDTKEDSSFAKKLLSPFYLLPYISIADSKLRPYTDKVIGEIPNWLCYEGVNSKPQERTNDITTKMVWTKMEAFIRHFNYLFQDKDCPIIISTIGIADDTNVIKGIVEYIRRQAGSNVQKIELHEYVNNLMEETFFEKLNRLDSIDAITRELVSLGLKLESKGEYTSQEIVHLLFTRLSFYKHHLEEGTEEIGYCHIAFYQMDTGDKFIKQVTSALRTELSFNGLISIPSTCNKDESYIIGYGTKGVNSSDGFIHPMTSALNTIYANEENEGSNVFDNNTCIAKKYKFSKSALLNSICENANWVTFINPEVDINFFYQQNLYIVHYTDQYTINAKYDSITVTRHVDQYENMLRKSYQSYALSDHCFNHFNETMMNYFNCLNGSWMLDIVNKTESQIREKMSIVAASITMLQFMGRNKNIHWIPISLEEILRVTGSIGLPKDYIFSKSSLNVSGAMSDDLLMMGLDDTDPADLKLYLYPVEVKFSKNAPMADKASKQVCQTYTQFKEHILGEANFTKNIYRSFFAAQFLTNAEKLNANSLLTDAEYAEIEKCRYQLLNLKYSIAEELPEKDMGRAAILLFYSNAPHSLTTSLIGDISICEIHFQEKECFQFVADPDLYHLDFLKTDPIIVSAAEPQLDNISKKCIEVSSHHDVMTIDFGEDNEDDVLIHAASPTEYPEYLNTSPVHTQATSENNSIRIIIGKTSSNGQEVIFEPNNTRQVSHPNMGIIGTMGTGKTQLARSVIAQFAKESNHNVGGRPVGMLVFDYKGDYKDPGFINMVGGVCYKFNFPFNPLKLVITNDVEGVNLPAITADRISDSFAKAYGLGLKQQSNIKQVIIDTYADAGITRDPRTWSKTVPTMEQVIDKYFDTYDANDKAFALFDKLRDYTIFATDNSMCVSLFEWLDRVRVIDLTLYPDDTKRVIVSLILDLFYAEMRQLGGSAQENGYRELRAMIMVDEAHQFLQKDFNSFRSIISEGRMFGVGMILSTQNISDFKTSKEDYSQFILSWVIHHVNSISKSEISSIFGASDTNGDKYMNYINKAKLFESVCKIGSRVEGVRDLPFFELIESDNRFI